MRIIIRDSFERKLMNLSEFAIERERSPPHIKDGFPKNRTVLVNSTVELECPTLSDMGTIMYWIKGLVVNNSIPANPNKLEVRLEVF